jgi:lipoprotein-releasing system ATP-binding protein
MDHQDAPVLVEVKDLHKSFIRPEGVVSVLNGIDLTIKKGDAAAVVGISGAGKSTLLHILGTLEPPTAGTVSIAGQAVETIASRELAEFRNQNLGFVFQFHHLLPEFSALENTMMPALISRLPVEEARERAEKILADLGLGHRMNHKTGELSGGEQQRVAIARAVILAPALILADEPTGNLDAATGRAVEDILLNLNRERGITLLIVTHNEGLARRMDYLVRIHDGRVAGIEPGDR